MALGDLPRGTVTFLFTDIEGSTALLQQLGHAYSARLEDHRRLLRSAVQAEDGVEVNTEGDAFFFVFASAPQAVAAASAGQRALARFPWPDNGVFRVRMGLHTGEGKVVGRDYVGLDVHRAARIGAAGHGGQIVLSRSTQVLIEHALPEGVHLRDLGEHRLKDLHRPEHLFQLVLADLPAEFPPLRTLNSIPNNLPTQLTSFVGRDRELAEARRLVSASRLLTLTGPGGTGKTRLALQLAAELIDQFPHGAYFVPLAATTDPALVASTMTQTLGVQESGGRSPRDRLLEHLADKELLLLLDNFEQVLPAALLVGDLLKTCPRLKVLVTSRAALHVSGEQEFPVPPLRLPDPKHLPDLGALSQYEAVALFIQRAVTVKPDFQVTNENAPAVAEITARLDGLPLAIELAAARVKLLPPDAMLARLQDRLSLLQSSARDLPARQQTLRNAIAWSYDLLDDGGRRLLARLAVFVGGCGLAEAELVCGPSADLGQEVLNGLEGLVDHSLLRQIEPQGEPRFVMLETIREFAREHLNASREASEILRRHAQVYLAVAEQAGLHLMGPDRTIWLDRLEQDHDNLRAALAWSIQQAEADIALRLLWSLWRFWQMRGHLHEARSRLDLLFGIPGLPAHKHALAKALEAAGGIAYWQGDFDAAATYYEQNLTIQRDLGDSAGIANSLYNLSFAYGVTRTKKLERARVLLEECLGLFRDIGDQAGIARGLWALGMNAYLSDDFSSALNTLKESIAIFRRLSDRFGLGWALHTYGLLMHRTGDLTEARNAFEEGLTLFEEARDVSGVVGLIDDLSALAVSVGELDRAARLAGAAASLQASSGTELAAVINAVEGRSRPGEQAVDEATLAAAWAEGHAMALEEIVAYALRRGSKAAPHAPAQQ